MNYNESMKQLKGVGDKTNNLFKKLGIETIEQFLHYYPRTYDVIETPIKIQDIVIGKKNIVYGTVKKQTVSKKVGRLQIDTFLVSDESGLLQVTFFNKPYIKKSLKLGNTYYFRGKSILNGTIYVMEQPTIYSDREFHTICGRMLPVYTSTAGLSQNQIRKYMKLALDALDNKEYIPSVILEKYQLISRKEAMLGIHFPKDMNILEEARKRLVFEELLIFLFQLKKLKFTGSAIENKFRMIEVADTRQLLERLPFRLTQDQLLAWKDIVNDLSGAYVMNRLIQGDVGSGKTLIAVLVLLMTAANGLQAAFMAPTEVLARQHYNTICEYVEKYGIRMKPVLLLGTMTLKEKRKAYESIENGEVNIVIGTHAVFQEKVHFKNLALVITDEQHRFGVLQREYLANKGENPHVMVMSATPIPRTLAMILYSDVSVSTIKQLPEGRVPIKNCVVGTSYRKSAYDFFRKEIEQGHQIYVICPMIEPDDESELENTLDYVNKLREFYSDRFQIAALHGKMHAKEKQSIMDAFLDGKIDILVSTTVIEVGVNVPNATVMMIENAERFGLAQLHQLRGRVGRGKVQSYCIFMDTMQSEKSKKRLEVLNHSNDGFYIAEQDLKMRGPGDLIGVRQSGEMQFQLADIYQDKEVFIEANEACEFLLNNSNTTDEWEIQNYIHFLDGISGKNIDFPSI